MTNDVEMLEFLMNSEFTESYKPEEYRNFLLRFKVLYRVLHGRSSSDIFDLKFRKKELEEINKSIKSENEILRNKNKSLEILVSNLKLPRKLSFGERVSGTTRQIT